MILRIPRASPLLRSIQIYRRQPIIRNQGTMCLLGSTTRPRQSAFNINQGYASTDAFSTCDSQRCQHRSFSAKHNISYAKTGMLSISSSSLPLFSSMIEPHLATIQLLPEVQYALQNKPSPSSIEGLTRALDIFAQMKPGGDEYCAILAMLADCHARIGQYSRAQEVLKTLQKRRRNAFDVNLSKSKAEWCLGYFSEASHTCINEVFRSRGVVFEPLKMSTAQNSMGLISLFLEGEERTSDSVEVLEEACYGLIEDLNSEKGDEDSDQKHEMGKDEANMDLTAEETAAMNQVVNAVQESIDLTPQPMTNLIQTDDQIKLAAAIGFNNLGIALVINPQPEGDHMAAWREGLDVLDRLATQTTLANSIRIRLLLNLAITLLKQESDESLKTASGYAKGALRLSEDRNGIDPCEYHFMLGRSLSVVASCFLKADSAVTAEGLFQSSLDALKKGVGPLNQLVLKETYLKYSILCQKWDKRKADAKRLEQDHKGIRLPNGWNGQQEILAGLVFYGPGDL